jgi:hypothetical protein
VKYLCLAYGSERDWKALSEKEQNELLDQDESFETGEVGGNLLTAIQA